MTDEQSESMYRQAIVEFADVLAGARTVTLNRCKVAHRRLLHGLTYYVHDTATAALVLIDGGQISSAAVLARVGLEHAALAQWITLQPDGANKFVKEMQVQSSSFATVAQRTGVQLPPEIAEWHESMRAAKHVQDIRETETMFKAINPEGWLYVHWRHLSQYVHPSIDTTSRYFADLADGREVAVTEPQAVLPPHVICLTLALSVSLATSPYLDLVRTKPFKSRLRQIADAAGIPLWASDPGLSGPPPSG